ncbi:MAG: TonB-dependent siderophore receptor [Aphanocapsa sp. GSE-SYN-MK-11-07L]|jgi:iron complex outermembrane receptor protein|nr:TonB-dependent siderophore receptor [Aphanocapsa sp. GSE-SYN-MK-11-07L]
MSKLHGCGWLKPAQMAIAGLLLALSAEAAAAGLPLNPETSILRVDDLPQSATTVKDWLAQMEAATVQITNIKLDRSEAGLEITLETAEGKTLQVDATKFRAEGNSLIAEIPNAVLALPEGQAFQSENPTADIATVQVVQQDSSVRVSVVGKAALPTTEVTIKTGGFAYSLNPEDEAAEEELVVTGEGEGRYFVPDTSIATKTDTPIRDIPASIQIVPQQVIRDRNVRTVGEAVETVSGVVETISYLAGSTPVYTGRSIRGFQQDFTSNLRNGFRDEGGGQLSLIGTIEQVEVLKGPASVLFGAVEPGGVINLVTRQPLAQPYYKIGFEAASFGQYQPSIDFSGPLNTDKSVLYRIIAAYRGGGDFQDTTRAETTSIAPSLTFRLGDRTNLNLYYEYGRYYADRSPYPVPLLSDGRLPPKNLYPAYFSAIDVESHQVGYTLNHEFNEEWQIRHHLAARFSDYRRRENAPAGVLDDLFLVGHQLSVANDTHSGYFGQIDLVGKFKTGSISHQLVAGFDFNSFESNAGFFYTPNGNLPALDIFNPNYDVPRPFFPAPNEFYIDRRRFYGIYLQDQIAFSNNLKMLIGGRYDWTSTESGLIGSDIPTQNDGAFSPRIGLVYQPSQTVSLYASYSQSFRPTVGRNPDDDPFEPTRGTQYEVGVKADFLDGKLSTTLAAYHLTKTNVLTPDPDPILAQQGFSVQVGEQRSRGIELDMAGEILPGWKIIASYALTDAQVTADNSIPSTVGNRLTGVPQNQASLWTTYEIQRGDLRGLGIGLGLFYVGQRQGNLANSFQIGDYLRTDAAIYYRRGGFNAAVNIRNLFDIDYVSSPGFDRLGVNRGLPLTIIGSISWEF